MKSNSMDLDQMAHDFLLNEGLGGELTLYDYLKIISETAGLINATSQRDQRWVNVIKSQARRAMTATRKMERQIEEMEDKLMQYRAYKNLGE